MTEEKRTPDQIVGRTVADLFFHGSAGPKLEAALARVVDWSVERAEVAGARVTRLFSRVDEKLEAGEITPKAIPERVALEIMENVAREERDELHELWANLLVCSARGLGVDALHIDVVRKLDPIAVRALLAIGIRFDSTHYREQPSSSLPSVHYLHRPLGKSVK